MCIVVISYFFFFNDTATTEIYTLSLHDALPILALRYFNVYGTRQALSNPYTGVCAIFSARLLNGRPPVLFERSEEHTSELQSRQYLVCRLLLEKKKNIQADALLEYDHSLADLLY